jgi:hypothetical protein
VGWGDKIPYIWTVAVNEGIPRKRFDVLCHCLSEWKRENYSLCNIYVISSEDMIYINYIILMISAVLIPNKIVIHS